MFHRAVELRPCLQDFYTCTRGDRDYQLYPALKFWRIRLYVVPSAGFKELSKYVLGSKLVYICLTKILF